MALSDEELARRQRRFDNYERRATPVLLINGFLYLACFVTLLTHRDPLVEWIFKITWFAFIVDYAIMFLLVPRRLWWATRHFYYLIALVFPPLRILLLVMLAQRAVMSRNSPMRDRVGLLGIYITAIIVVFGAYFVWQFERTAPGASIRTYGESLWWAIVTITTVGYGDFVPVTLGGRIIATIVLVNGLAAIAVVTGVVVAYFSADARKQRELARAGETADAADRLERLRSAAQHAQHVPGTTVDLASIDRRLAAIEEALAIGHPAVGSAAPSEVPPTLAGQAGAGAQAPARRDSDDQHGHGQHGPAAG